MRPLVVCGRAPQTELADDLLVQNNENLAELKKEGYKDAVVEPDPGITLRYLVLRSIVYILSWPAGNDLSMSNKPTEPPAAGAPLAPPDVNFLRKGNHGQFHVLTYVIAMAMIAVLFPDQTDTATGAAPKVPKLQATIVNACSGRDMSKGATDEKTGRYVPVLDKVFHRCAARTYSRLLPFLGAGNVSPVVMVESCNAVIQILRALLASGGCYRKYTAAEVDTLATPRAGSTRSAATSWASSRAACLAATTSCSSARSAAAQTSAPTGLARSATSTRTSR